MTMRDRIRGCRHFVQINLMHAMSEPIAHVRFKIQHTRSGLYLMNNSDVSPTAFLQGGQNSEAKFAESGNFNGEATHGHIYLRLLIHFS